MDHHGYLLDSINSVEISAKGIVYLSLQCFIIIIIILKFDKTHLL